MIQFNLLPDVKLTYLKARRAQRLVIVGSALVSAIAITILIIMFVIADGLQKKNISDLSNDIKTETAKVKSSPDINKVLTIQDQLTSLPSLEAQDPNVSRVFGYLQQVTPPNVSISNFSFGLLTKQFTMSGSADSLATINGYVDTLIFTKYKANSNDPGSGSSAFTQVSLTSYGLASGPNGKASFTISGGFDSALFDVASTNTSLTVPTQTTTRSILDQPQIFQTNSTNSTTNPPGSGGG